MELTGDVGAEERVEVLPTLFLVSSLNMIPCIPSGKLDLCHVCAIRGKVPGGRHDWSAELQSTTTLARLCSASHMKDLRFPH